MEAGGAWVLSWMLGWAVTDPRRFPGPAYGFWVPPSPPLVFLGGPISRMSVTMGSILMAPLTQHCLLLPASTRFQGLVHPSLWTGHLGGPLPSTWPLSSWAQYLISITVDLAITHPSSALPPSSSLRAHLASRALYMVGFHSFVCTFGEGLLCARPCARHRVNGHCP